MLEDADGLATRAITIDAPAFGGLAVDRPAGAVPARRRLYLRLDREPARPEHALVDRVLPEYQHPQIGDGFGYGANRMSFTIVEPEHVLATQSADGNWVWTFVLEEKDGRPG